jgi:hypothetical protein
MNTAANGRRFELFTTLTEQSGWRRSTCANSHRHRTADHGFPPLKVIGGRLPPFGTCCFLQPCVVVFRRYVHMPGSTVPSPISPRLPIFPSNSIPDDSGPNRDSTGPDTLDMKGMIMPQSVQLQSTWTSNHQSTPYQGTGTFTFTYDNAATPSNTNGNTATYTNAISAATFAFSNLSLSLDSAGDNTINIYVLDGLGTNARISLSLRDANGNAYALDMSFEDSNHQSNDFSLSNLIGLLTTDTNTTTLTPAGVAPTPGKYVLRQQSALSPVGA